MRQPLLPVFRDQLALLVQLIHVILQRQGYHVRIQSIDHCPGLFAATAMRLLHGDIVAGLGFPVFGKGLVVLLIELPGRIVGHIEQIDVVGPGRVRQPGQA